MKDGSPESPSGIPRIEWDFDNVPELELVACCYWEYARESAFIRDVRRRCADWTILERSKGKPWERLLRDWERIQSIGYAAQVFLNGFLLKQTTYDPNCYTFEEAPPFTGSFPAPWQSLLPVELCLRAKIHTDIEVSALVPINNGGSVTAAELLLESAREYLNQYMEAELEAHRKHPGVGGGTLRRAGKLPLYRPKASVLWEEGSESTILEIQWAHFTNDQIVKAFRKWVKANRPKDISKPNKQGHKDISHRVDLERLAIMRLLCRFTPTQLRENCPAAWKRYNTTNRRWRRDAEKARARFHSLLPFLLAKENPLSWPPKNCTRQPA